MIIRRQALLATTLLLGGGTLLATVFGCGNGSTGAGGSSSTATSSSSSSASSVATTTSASTSASSSSTGGGLPPWGGTPPTLTIAPCTDANTYVSPDAGNEGQLAAGRLTPPTYPFQVTSIEYELVMNDPASAPCDATLAHRVEIYVDTNVTPSNTPVIAATFDVAAMPGIPVNTHRLVTRTLATPITLTAGQNLFVAVELAGTGPDHLCIPLCAGTGADDRNYWSNATMPPYNWATLASFNNMDNLRVGANGM